MKSIALIFSALLVLPQSVYSVEVGGFIDTQYHSMRSTLELDGTTWLGHPSTFSVNQGALYLSKKSGTSEFFIDLPFASNQSQSDNNLTVAARQAQAYVKHSYDSGLNWSLGQFDTIFGFELNDTIDTDFLNQGIVYNILPVTHTGFLLNHQRGTVGVSLMAANSGGTSRQTNTSKTEVGLRFAWKDRGYSLGVGALINMHEGTSNVTNEELISESLINFVLGFQFDALRFDFAYDTYINKGGEKKVLEGAQFVDLKPLTGMLFQLSYDADDNNKFCLRYESVAHFDSLSDMTVFTGAVSVNDSKRSKISLGYIRQMSEEMKVKISASSESVIVLSGGESASWSEAGLAAIYGF